MLGPAGLNEGTRVATVNFPKTASRQIIPTLGTKVYKWYVLLAIWSLRVWHTYFQAAKLSLAYLHSNKTLKPKPANPAWPGLCRGRLVHAARR